MKRKFWTRDWFTGLILVAVFATLSQSGWVRTLERSTYDLGVRMAERDPGNDIAVIAIDDESLDNLGRWPWSRDLLAGMIDTLDQADARVIGLTVLLSEPQVDPGLVHLRELRDFFESRGLDEIPETDDGEPGERTGSVHDLGERILAAEQALDTDSRLAESLRNAGNVVLGMQLVPGRAHGNPPRELPGHVLDSRIPPNNILLDSTTGMPPATISASPPIARLGEPAAATGHLVSLLDVDGAVRTEPLVLDYYGDFIPSMSLQLAAQSLRMDNRDIRVSPGKSVQVGGLDIRTDAQSQMNSFFYARHEFPVDSFYDVYSGRIDPGKYSDRIVLIGPTAFGLGSSLSTPAGTLQPVNILAHSLASILNEDFLVRPGWAGWITWSAFVLVGLYLMLALPRLGAGLAAGISAALLIVLAGSEIIVLASQGLWIPLMLPATLLFTGHLLLTTKGFLLTERSKEKSEAESAESNRMLGLAFQQQGQLDMAFEKFRRAPLNDEIMDPLYNLALDFERKRQFNKAAAVYEYMAGHDPQFRDISRRGKRATEAQDTVIFGAPGTAGGAGDTLLGEGAEFEKPMLGRYEVEKELGRGAMGIVYQGRDPKINRVVAIKTLALSQEFEERELAEVKERFFREAEAAGKLNHPDIVTVYDAGEEHDLAYIAMEFLQGEDLVPHARPDNLLPVPRVLNIVARTAEALDYAHQHQIVHRDIKPANLMYESETSNLKITDFGIARVSNISRTKTGMVAGTPGYMSPEQVRGKKVDGRSDLFSLGITLYQLLTGEQPFQGEDTTQIMYRIATEPHPDINQQRPMIRRNLPWVRLVIDRALEKDPDKRYQRGSEMARDLKVVMKKMAALQRQRKEKS